MILIIGGSYQGKLDFAKSRFGLSDADVFACDDRIVDIDFTRRCIAYADRFALGCVRRDIEPADVFRVREAQWQDAVIVVTDISGGVVPMDATLRAWREACGRMNAYLAGQAEEVWRLFCGIPQRLK